MPFLPQLPVRPSEQRHRPLHQIAVVVLARVPADEDLGLPRRHLARQLANVLRVDPADLTRLLRRVVLQMPPQADEDRLHLHRRQVLEQHRVAALQGRIDTRGGQRAPRRRGQRPRQRVPPVELVLPLPLHHVAAAQETTVVLAHQQREIGLLLHELLLVEARVDDHLAHRQGQRRVGADPHRQVVVGVDRRGAVVRRHRHHLAAVVTGLGQVVVPLDVGVDRVGVPDQRQIGQEPVVHGGDGVVEPPGQVPAGAEVLELRIAVGGRRPEHVGELTGRKGTHLGCQQREDRFRAVVLDGIEDGVGDVGERLVPGDLLELALAALADPLEGLGDAVRRVVAVAPAGPLLAAHRVHVRDPGLDRGVDARLLLADDLPVLGVDAEGTATRVAVHLVTTPGHGVPGPPAAIPIGPSAADSRHLDSPVRDGESSRACASARRRADPPRPRLIRVAPVGRYEPRHTEAGGARKARGLSAEEILLVSSARRE